MAKFSAATVALSVLVAFTVTGCSSNKQTFARPSRPKIAVHSAYIVETDYSIVSEYDDNPLPESGMIIKGREHRVAPMGNTAWHIGEALRNHEIQPTIGKEPPTTTNWDIVVRYQDEWQWDVKKYLKKLHIVFYDAKTGEKIVETTYRPKKIVIQTFPTPAKMVPEIIHSMIRKL